MTWFTYILRCADDSLYTGITIDLNRRLDEHNTDNKKGARYTRARRPVNLVYQQVCEDRASAGRLEYQLKNLNRKQKLALLKTGNSSI
ncbi:MAG: putative endonuclease [Arenicella sp.]|jgi:putative endonuclease